MEEENDNVIVSETPGKSKAMKIILIVLIGLIVLGGGGYAMAKYYKNKQAANGTKQAEDTSGSTDSTAGQVSSSTKSTADNPATDINESSWIEYQNSLIKYLVRYPKDAKIEEISAPKASTISQAKCIKISTDNYYVIIGDAAVAENEPALCFRTGVGADWSNGPADSVTAAGMTYSPNGMHTEAASAGYYQDFFMIAPVDQRVKIEYGTSVNEKYGTITKVEAKNMVHAIVASYNPAE